MRTSGQRLVAAAALRRSLIADGHDITVTSALDAVEVAFEAADKAALHPGRSRCPDCWEPASRYGTLRDGQRLCAACSIRCDEAVADSLTGLGAPS